MKFRQKTSEDRIQRAFIKLLSEQSFQQLTVQNIITKAGVARGTFYRYYLDKFDLLNRCEDQLTHESDYIFRQYRRPDLARIAAHPTNDAFFKLMEYLYQNRQIVITLINCSASNLWRKIHDLVAVAIGTHATDQIDQNFEITPDLARELLVQNVMTLLKYWLTQPTVITPTGAYQVFIKSRTLSPVDLAQELAANKPVSRLD
ncbi:TetR family transcriptional regulator [Lactiplantibacillus plantarum]|uniref:TetR/AcrR family transcriptional regulator n=1 Tax=Lactiplantibacillus plantarum TaxID=1590 RepID=UPI001AAF1B3E|nr:TetR/AcrR family transcriptional regulator [Lactiplantibacillus plantarum]QTF53113.1 TetR family transcriptional regulator [Lactiplantibacillus plantarum]